MDIEALTKFFTKEINNSSSGINLSNEEFEDVWNNCEKVNFSYDKIKYKFGSEENALASQFCRYYPIFKKYYDIHTSKYEYLKKMKENL